jgi:glycosyltransferase involved in cell wall biosynthesis
MMDAANLKETGVALLASRLCVLGDDPCGGSEVVLWEDARILRSAGIPVRVYARAARARAPVRTIPLRTPTAQLNTIEYLCAVLRNEPRAPIVAYNEPALAGAVPGRGLVRFDWAAPLPRYWNWPFWRSRFARARYVFPSESERQSFLLRHAGIPSPQTAVISNAIDLELFKPPGRLHHHEPNRLLRVGFAGQWVARKGLDLLLQAWRALAPGLPNCELYVAGGASLWKNVAGVSGAEELAARIHAMERDQLLLCVGALPRSAMPAFWAAVDIAVVPSLYEPFGLVALEALACGVPVVAAGVGGLKEIVVDGECGLLVPPGDAAALARALHRLLADEALRLRLASGARLRAQYFSLQRRSHELLELLLGRADKDGVQFTERNAPIHRPRKNEASTLVS